MATSTAKCPGCGRVYDVDGWAPETSIGCVAAYSDHQAHVPAVCATGAPTMIPATPPDQVREFTP